MKRIRRRFRPRPMTLRRKSLYAALVAIPLLGILTFGNRGLFKRIQLENEVASLRQTLYHDRATSDSLRVEINKIKQDTTAVERLARERYGMVRPGETIYKVDE
jgi:cell division protein FtsB